MNHPIAAILLVTTAISLGGCGQTGPLYMPAPEPAPEQTADEARPEQPQDKGT